MAKFCTKCGKPLVDGKPCDCSKEHTKEEPREEKKVEVEVEEEEESSQLGNILNDYLDIVKGMFKKPVATLEKYLNTSYFNLAIISIALNAIVFGIFTHIFTANCLKKIGLNLGNIQTFIQTATQEISKLGVPIKINTNIGLSFGICMALVSVITIVIMYIMHTQVFKKKMNIKKIVVLVGICEVFLTIGYLISIVGSYLNIFLGILIFTFFAIIFFVHLHQGYMKLSKTTKDQSVYTSILGLFVPVVGYVITFTLMLVLSIIITGMTMYNTQTSQTASTLRNSSQQTYLR